MAVLEGAGVGYLSELDILPDMEAERVIRILKDWTPPYPGLCLHYPGRRNLSAGMRAFLELARELSRRGDRLHAHEASCERTTVLMTFEPETSYTSDVKRLNN